MYGEATRLESSINHLKHSRECYMKNKVRGARLSTLFFIEHEQGYALTYTLFFWGMLVYTKQAELYGQDTWSSIILIPDIKRKLIR